MKASQISDFFFAADADAEGWEEADEELMDWEEAEALEGWDEEKESLMDEWEEAEDLFFEWEEEDEDRLEEWDTDEELSDLDDGDAVEEMLLVDGAASAATHDRVVSGLCVRFIEIRQWPCQSCADCGVQSKYTMISFLWMLQAILQESRVLLFFWCLKPAGHGSRSDPTLR